MDLNFIFLLFINYCKNLLSPYVSKILISLIISKCVLVITEPKKNEHIPKLNINYYNTPKTKLKFHKKDNSKHLLSKEYSNLLNRLNSIDCCENYCKYCSEKPLEIVCSLKHLKNSTHLKKDSFPLKLQLKISESKNIDSLPPKTPILLSNLNIFDIFKGNICFSKNITSIKEIKNKFILTSSNLIIDKDNKKCGILFLEGYLESDITYYLPECYKLPLISQKENCVIKTPFNDGIFLMFDYEIAEYANYFNSLNISLKEYKFTLDVKLLDKYPLDDSIYLYNNLKLSIIVESTLELYAFNNKI